MASYALDDLGDAIEVTRGFLLPFDRRRWAKLALLAFFVGVPGMNVLQFNAAGGTSSGPPGRDQTGVDLDVGFDETVLALVFALIAAVVLVGLLFVLVGSVMEFVPIESLRNESIRIRRYWSRRWRQGVRLFGFRIVLGLLALGPIFLVVGLTVVPFVLTGEPGLSVAALLLALPLLFLFALLVGVVNGFTTSFVVPVMIRGDWASWPAGGGSGRPSARSGSSTSRTPWLRTSSPSPPAS